jgi:hypothetical protein
MLTTSEDFDQYRIQLDISSGRASCIDTGGPGRPALFVHD